MGPATTVPLAWPGFWKPPPCPRPDACLPSTSGKDWVEREDVGDFGLGPEALRASRGWQVTFPHGGDRGGEEKLGAEGVALITSAPGDLEEEAGVLSPSEPRGARGGGGLQGFLGEAAHPGRGPWLSCSPSRPLHTHQ